MITGLLIKESLLSLNILEHVTITKEDRWDIDDAAEGQDSVWNIVYFEFEDSEIDNVTKEISESLKEGKWFVDFRDNENVYLVFKNKVFKYKKGDTAARKGVEKYAVEIVGIPTTQLNWEE